MVSGQELCEKGIGYNDHFERQARIAKRKSARIERLIASKLEEEADARTNTAAQRGIGEVAAGKCAD